MVFGTNRSILELLLRTKKTGEGAKDVKKELGDLKQVSGQAGAAAEKLNLGMRAVQGAALAAGLAVLRAVPGLVSLGSQSIRAQQALTGLAGGSRQAQEALDAVSRGAGGAIDRMSAAQNAARLFSMGLIENAEEAERLTSIATTLGAAMGKEAQPAFEEFTLLLANQSILRLDTYGISAGQVRERMAELAQEMPELDRQTRFVMATMEQAEQSMTKLAEGGFEATTAADRFGARIETAKQQVGEFLSRGLLPYLEIAEALPAVIRGHSGAVEESIPTLMAEKEALLGVAEASGETAANIAAATVSTRELSAATLGQQAMTDLNRALEDGWLSQEEYDVAAREVMSTLLGLSKNQIDANFAVREASNAFQEGGIGAEQYLTLLQNINAELSRMRSLGGPLESGGGAVAGGATQVGGAVGPGQARTVGEKGPELFFSSGRAGGFVAPAGVTNNLEFGRNQTIVLNTGEDVETFLNTAKRAFRRL